MMVMINYYNAYHDGVKILSLIEINILFIFMGVGTLEYGNP